MKKYGKAILFPGIAVIILLVLFLQHDSSPEEGESYTISAIPQQQIDQVNSEEKKKEQQAAVKKIMVDIKGAVQYPGVYELTTEDRIVDAIEAAGGYTEEAQNSAINHAQKLQDEMAIYIPEIGEEEAIQTVGQVISGGASNDSSSEQVDINQADEAALTTIPGIGPSKAQAIIAYREENGPFTAVEDLKNVSGIGDKTFEKLKDYITVK